MSEMLTRALRDAVADVAPAPGLAGRAERRARRLRRQRVTMAAAGAAAVLVTAGVTAATAPWDRPTPADAGPTVVLSFAASDGCEPWCNDPMSWVFAGADRGPTLLTHADRALAALPPMADVPDGKWHEWWHVRTGRGHLFIFLYGDPGAVKGPSGVDVRPLDPDAQFRLGAVLVDEGATTATIVGSATMSAAESAATVPVDGGGLSGTVVLARPNVKDLRYDGGDPAGLRHGDNWAWVPSGAPVRLLVDTR